MTLKEKIENTIYDYVRSEYDRRDVCNALVVDIDAYAIEFADWLMNLRYYTIAQISTKSLLEEFKKEKGLC